MILLDTQTTFLITGELTDGIKVKTFHALYCTH
jgi:hypothetical protein